MASRTKGKLLVTKWIDVHPLAGSERCYLNLTKTFRAELRARFGTPVTRKTSAAFTSWFVVRERGRYGPTIDGWHGDGHYGSTQCVFTVYDDGTKIARWTYPMDREPDAELSDEGLASYRAFLTAARAAVEARWPRG